MGIENTFRNSKEVLRIDEITEKYPQSFSALILTFQSKVLSGLLALQLIEELEDCSYGSSHGKYPIYRLRELPDTLFYLSPIGAPTTVGILEELVYAFSIKHLIMYGSCGVLDREITAGKVIVPRKAYRDEGTSYHYAPASDFINITNHAFVSNILTKANIDHVCGSTWTTDAFYRETQAICAERRKQGCIAVEMEVSAVQAFADLRKVNFYSFLYGADLLDDTKWEKRILGNLQVTERVKYFMIATELAKSLQKKDNL